MENRVQLLESGLKCDNPSCDWVDKTIKHTEYINHINSPCPKCGENILTEVDYNNTMLFHSIVDMVNSMSEEELNAIQLDGAPSLFSEEEIKEIKNNPNKEFTVDVDLHNGIKMNVKK